MFSQSITHPIKILGPPPAYPGAPPDAERAHQPPLPELLYEPYADKPGLPDLLYEPYGGEQLPQTEYEPYAEKTTPKAPPYQPYKDI
jgi:hypothetical protein